MKNKFNYLFVILFVNLLLTFNVYSDEIFNFNVTTIEILDNGNKFKGYDRGIISTKDGITIDADTFEYEKSSNYLNAKGAVIIKDAIRNYIIYADEISYFKDKEVISTNGNSKIVNDENQEILADKIEYNKLLNIINANGNVEIKDTEKDYALFGNEISYFKNEEKILTKGKTSARIENIYEIFSENLTFLLQRNILKSENKTRIVKQNIQSINLDKFKLSLNEEQLIGENILFINNFGLPKSDKFYFSSAIINLKNDSFIAKDTEITIHKEIFNNPKNDPRIKGVSATGNNQIRTLNKAIFTSCQINDDCPPWSLSAKSIEHDKKKKQITYDSAILRIYDFPVLYFPKFFHPDPTVKRQSGLLQPHLNNSNILGNSLQIPYYKVISGNKDNTLYLTLFDTDTKMLQNEYRQVNEKSSFIADLGFVKNYKPSDSNEKNILHYFSKFNLDLDFTNYNASSLDVSVERINNDTYLKVFDSIVPGNEVKPSDTDLLTNQIILSLDHEKFKFDSGIKAYEDLHKKNSDRYQYILPYYNFSTILNDNYFLGETNFSSKGSNELIDTNNLRSKVINDINFKSKNFISNLGIQNNFTVSFKNLNSVGKNDTEYKSTPQIELMGNIDLNSSLPLIKEEQYNSKFFTPKIKLKFNPSDMKNYSDADRKINVSNIFNENRLGLTDSIETGKSLTFGFDFKNQNKNDFDKYFEMKLATVFRDEEEGFIPKQSTIGKKNSNLFGSITNSFNEYVNFNYIFAVDNNYDVFEYNDVNATISVNNFITEFNFIEETGEMGESNIFENKTSYNFDENNNISFNTRRNRKLNLTEYYDLVYEYKNDCLTASVKYKKSYYEDRALKPSEDLMFTLTLFPLTTYEQKIDN